MFLSNRLFQAASKKTMTTGLKQFGMRRTLTATQVNFFSEETQKAPVEEPKVETASTEPTAAEIEKSREEWGIKYDDECLKFEKEWQEIA